MCIIAYKPEAANFPTKATLQTCFANNPDGAGFMYAAHGAVYIEKGFATFNAFWRALKAARAEHGDRIACIMHFRIATQGGTKPECTHPFPLSPNMDDLRLLHASTDIGIAHNGIIPLTTSYYKAVNYSDTMLFIADYLSLIIKRRDYYKDADTLLLIERLCESKLAILDYTGHCELIGRGWINDGGLYYSNTSYKESRRRAADPLPTRYIYDGKYDTDDDGYNASYCDDGVLCEAEYTDTNGDELYLFRDGDTLYVDNLTAHVYDTYTIDAPNDADIIDVYEALTAWKGA